MRVLGIDPGTAIIGYGIIDYEKNKYKVVDYGCIYTDKSLLMDERLLIIFNELSDIIKKYQPDEMAVEDLFYFKNNKTIISVGQARGVIILSGKINNLSLNSYTPLQVKMGITGYGRSEKKQIQEAVKLLLKLDEIPQPDDAADALAISITHINTIFNGIPTSKDNSIRNLGKNQSKISYKDYRKMITNT